MPFRIFLSYHTPDHTAAEALRAAIEQTRAGAKVFFAPYSLKLGAFWLPQLGEAIEGSDAFLLLLGSRLGEWQKLEYYEAVNKHLAAKKAKKRSYPVVPVIIGGRALNLPFLSQLHWIEAGEPTAPGSLGAIVAALEGESIEAAPEPWRTINPYRGLEALDENDADFFFGRDAETVQVLDAIAKRQDKFIALIGNSGVGKSSLVRAGVISALKRQQMPGKRSKWPERLADSKAWAFVSMKPGNNPIRALASAFTRQWFEDPTDALWDERTEQWEARLKGNGQLSGFINATQERFKELGVDPPRRVFLYIDQGEELYAGCTSETIRRFSELLADGLADDRLIVMGSQRSDYYGHLQDNEALFPKTLRIDVPPLGAKALSTVLREPARVLDARIEPENLVDYLVDSTLGPQPIEGSRQDNSSDKDAKEREISASAALPLLADFMTDLWGRMQSRSDGVLRFTDRTEIIQVGASLAARADRFLRKPDQDEDAVKRLFTLKLALVQEVGDPVRRRVCNAHCTDQEWALIEMLAGPEWRLLVVGEEDGEPIAEIAHEVLLREWPTLKRWLVDEHDFLVWKGNLERDLKAYNEAKPKDKQDALLMGLSLNKAESWFNTRPRDDIGEDNAHFIELSIEHKKQRDLEEEARRQKELDTARELAAEKEQAARRQRRLSFVIGAAAIALALLTWFSYDRMQFAEEQAVEAIRQQGVSQIALAEARVARNEAQRAREDAERDQNRAVAALKETTAEKARADIERDRAQEQEEIAKAALANAERAQSEAEVAARRATKAEARAREQLRQAQISQSRFRAGKANELADIGDNSAAIALALTAMPQANSVGWPSISEIPEVPHSLTRALMDLKEKLVLRGHETWVRTAAFSPDGARIVTASDDGTALIWDAKSGTEVVALRGHEGDVNSAAFSPDGARIVTASDDGTARIWDAETGTETAVLRGHESLVITAAFSPDGARIVTTSIDGTARIWDANTSTETAVLRGHEDPMLTAAFSPDGARIVTASWDDTARIWDTYTGTLTGVLRGHEGDVNSAAFSPDGARIVTASSDHTARIWDAESGSATAVLRGHEGSVENATFSPQGTRIVTASEDDTARIWNAETGTLTGILRGHENLVHTAAFSPGGARIVTASNDKTARMWDADTGTETAVLRGHEDRVLTAAFSPHGARVVTASIDGTARIWDAKSGTEVVVLRGHDSDVNAASFSPDGSRIVTASDDDTARIWDAKSGAEVIVLRGHDSDVNAASFSFDGARIVTASSDKTARMWDADTGTETAVLRGHEGSVLTAAFSPDGSRIVTASDDDTARIWDAKSGAEVVVLRGHDSDVNAASFSPDGARIVTASDDNTARIWDTYTGTLTGVLRGHEVDVNSAAFSPDHARIITASNDGTARIWDADTGALTAVLRGHEQLVQTAAFSPYGARIVTASWDGTARIWDAETGVETAVLRGHQHWVQTATFSPDGTRIVTASNDNTARIWKAYPNYNDLYKAGVEVVERMHPLTRKEECEYYLRTEGCER